MSWNLDRVSSNLVGEFARLSFGGYMVNKEPSPDLIRATEEHLRECGLENTPATEMLREWWRIRDCARSASFMLIANSRDCGLQRPYSLDQAIESRRYK